MRQLSIITPTVRIHAAVIQGQALRLSRAAIAHARNIPVSSYYERSKELLHERTHDWGAAEFLAGGGIAFVWLVLAVWAIVG